jgi:FkbM family methyltransferase
MNNSLSDQLEALCNESTASFKLINPPYWTAEIYGFGRYIRKYGFYPSWLPLCVYTDHGPGACTPAPHELASLAPVQLYHSPISVNNWRAISKKTCYCFYSPFVFYRKKNKIEISADAKGTIAFPAHTTASIDDISDIQVYIDQLKNLPEVFQPVGVCLHQTDINKGLHKKFIDNGFDVFTAGNSLDDRFLERFYSIIKNFKYATSNILGSYTYYCVEMEIPFFIYGEKPQLINKLDLNIPMGEYDPYKSVDLYRKAHDLFVEISTIITEDQRSLVNRDLGKYDGIGRIRMALILYYSFFKWLLKWNNFVDISKGIFINIFKGSSMDRLLDLSLRKIIRRLRRMFQRSDLPVRLPITAKASVIELLGEKQYREISQLERFKEGELVIQGYSVRFTDNAALFGMLDEIFVRENYKFHCETNSPTIIDCGANIGLSVLYFKSQYPQAVIHAFEPDPGAYEKLVANIKANGFKDVFTYKAAVWIEDGELVFESDGSWGGHIGDDASAVGVTINARKLDGLLDKHVDFLKMDIEGAESDVIMHSKELIAKNVEKLFFEWHSLTGQPQRLGEILAFFEKHGFRYHIKEASNRKTPFIYKPVSRMDSQLDVFLWK